MLYKFLLTLLIFSITTSCSLTKKDLLTHEVLLPENWQTQIALPLEDRVIKESKLNIQDFIKQWKQVNTIDYKGIESESELQIKLIKKYIRVLPKSVYDFLNNKIAGIILVEDLNIPLVIQSVNSEKGHFLIFLDSKINSLGLNDWYTWREFSAFGQEDSNFVIEAFLSHKNSQKDTFNYVISQAVALILSADTKIFPNDLSKQPLKNLNFIKRSWINNKGIIQSHHDNLLDEMRYLSFYGGSTRTFPRDKIYNFYQRLEKTNFVNLYSTTGALRDFVESIAVYMHVYIFGKPFQIDFYESETLLESYSHCLNLPRCLGKKKDLTKILNQHIN